MRVLIYNELRPELIEGFDKVYQALETGNFIQADVRKIDDNLYRARLNRSDRLLFTLRRVAGETCCLILEHIPNHAYDKSRFLRGGAVINERKIPPIEDPETLVPESNHHLNPQKNRFNLLDKVLTFDDEQEHIYALNPPLVVVGSAGSGKTALALEKIKQVQGGILYISLSPYLIENARSLYYSHSYYNPEQWVEFLSFQEFMESIRIPSASEATAQEFQEWSQRQPEAKWLPNPYQVLEEFRGVIAGQPYQSPWLDRNSYLELGIRQSIFTPEQRSTVYDLFEKYLRWLKEQGHYDSSILSHEYLQQVEPSYDFIVVDEVQDLTCVQLLLILRSLRTAGNFLLCGDANQIVHPNYFSWSQVKSLLLHEQVLDNSDNAVQILHHNYRNSVPITEIANRILTLKQIKFGSVDRESSRLVVSSGDTEGTLQLLEDSSAVKQALNELTYLSTRVAVLVMHPEQKPAARSFFDTPLVFAIQEAKGLEYDSVIIYNFISDEAQTFDQIAAGTTPDQLDNLAPRFARPRDKTAKMLEVYKFYINALYVAVTRAVKNIYWIESNQEHQLLKLLALSHHTDSQPVADKQESSLEEWRKEAKRLEMQGKTEQVKQIHEKVLPQQKPSWSVISRYDFDRLRASLFHDGSKKYRLQMFEYALLHHHLPTLSTLAREGFGPAQQEELKAVQQVHRNHFMGYNQKNLQTVLKQTDRLGVNHRTYYNLTPLMIAARLGNCRLVEELLKREANTNEVAANGFTALHFALEQAYLDADFAARYFATLYRLLVPLEISVRTDNRLLKLDRQQMEFFLFHWLSTLFHRELGPLIGQGESGFSADWIAKSLLNIPDDILPQSCKNPSFISSVLANNEFRRNTTNNFRLFRHTNQGCYVINPGIQMRIKNTWVAYYNNFLPEDMDPGVTLARLEHENTSSANKSRRKASPDSEEPASIHRQRDQHVGIFRAWLREQTRTWVS